MSEELQGFAFKKTCWDDKEEAVAAIGRAWLNSFQKYRNVSSEYQLNPKVS